MFSLSKLAEVEYNMFDGAFDTAYTLLCPCLMFFLLTSYYFPLSMISYG